MKEEMKDLKSRVEALEQVSLQHTPLPCCSSRLRSASSHPGLFAARVSLRPGSIFNVMLA